MLIHKLSEKVVPPIYSFAVVRPIEMPVLAVLCEQAPTDSQHRHFCMAELLREN